jgi:hypothetical protein
VGLFSRWDSEYYGDISVNGYTNLISQKWEFFPFYPILLGVFGRLLAEVLRIPLNITVYATGVAISNLAFFGAVYFLYRLSERLFGGGGIASESGVLLSLFPAGVFLSAVYSESLFLLLMEASLFYWYTSKHVCSGILGFLAALTRPLGVFLVLPYMYEAVRDSSNRRHLRTYLPVVFIVVAYLSFMLYSQALTGTPLANFVAERVYWNVSLNPADVLSAAEKVLREHPLIVPYLFLGFGGVLASVATAKSSPVRGINLYSICLLFSYLVTPIISFPRYSITLLPMYWSLSALSRWNWLRGLLYAAFLLMLALGTSQFVNWYSFY